MQNIIQEELKREMQFLPIIEKAIAENAHLIYKSGINLFKLKKASQEDDVKNGFDFLFTMSDFKIPVRIRKPNCRYRDFTIRSATRYGFKTEIHKIKEGAGDVYFYAWTEFNEGIENITEYWLIDLHKFRSSGLLDKEQVQRDNGDGTSFVFYSFDKLNQHGSVISKFKAS